MPGEQNPYLRRSRVNWTPTSYGTNQNVDGIETNPGEIIVGVLVYIRTAFDGDAAVAIGDSGSANRYATTTDCGVTVTGLKSGTGAGFATTPGYLIPTTNLKVRITYTSTTATVGSLDLFVIYFNPLR